VEQIEAVLTATTILNRMEANEEWAFGGPAVLVEFRPEVNGRAVVDIVDRPWPDDMGDPQTEPMLFGAWTMGHFGPCTFPGNLRRAAQQCWAWDEGKTVLGRHRAFLRVRVTYAAHTGNLFPPDYDAVPELVTLTRLTRLLLELPGALAYFNPGGEVLRSAEGVDESLAHAARSSLPPLDLWSNIRLFNIGDGWKLMDTVGNIQLDRPDIEACFASQECGEVDPFLRNVTWYLLQQGEVINDGDTIGGPGDVNWRASLHDDALTDPSVRRVLRFLPEDGSEIPAALRRDGA
jgi:hypothetical protein